MEETAEKPARQLLVTSAGYEARQGYTVNKTFALLRALGRMQRPVGVTRLAVEVGIAKTTAHRLLEQMAQEDVVVRRDHKWALGTGLHDVDHRLADVVAIAQPRLHALTQATGASLFLYAEWGDTLRAISRSYGPRLTEVMPAAEQILAAEHPASAIWQALKRGRPVAEYGEVHRDCCCIATPFRLPSGDIAVLALTSPSRRDVEALKRALERNALLLCAEMRAQAR